MITFRARVEITNDRRIVLSLPPEVPVGPAELAVTIDLQPMDQAARTALSDWAEEETGRIGNAERLYPLRGSVIRYEKPTEPVAEGD